VYPTIAFLALAIVVFFHDRKVMKEFETTNKRIDGLYGGLARLGERLAGIEAFADSARNNLLRVDGTLPEISIQLRRLSENIEADRKERTEPLPDSWKAGEVALGRIARAKKEFADLEENSYQEMLAKANK
jgi:hypothetical protein